jgi:hypothetical protein
MLCRSSKLKSNKGLWQTIPSKLSLSNRFSDREVAVAVAAVILNSRTSGHLERASICNKVQQLAATGNIQATDKRGYYHSWDTVQQQ